MPTPEASAGGDQNVAVGKRRRLHDRCARPRVLPKQRAIGRGNAGHAGSAEQVEDLSTPSIIARCGEL